MKKKSVFFILFFVAVFLLTRALLTNWEVTAWAMFGVWIMCLFIGFAAIDKAKVLK